MAATLQDLHSFLLPGVTESPDSLYQLAKVLRKLANEAEEQAQNRPSGTSQEACEGVKQSSDGTDHSQQVPPKEKPKTGKVFDISSYHSRYVALEIMYVGWHYQGSTFQPHEENTVEGHLMRALKRTRLVSETATPETVNLSRGGRTDRGVSGVGQVVALNLRSKGRAADLIPKFEDEMDYPTTLNRVLPSEIRVIGCADIPQTFSARFSAQYREYRYFIPCSGDLNLEAMQTAASHFVGEHDYRNFCKVDAEHVKHFVRHIQYFQIHAMPDCQAGTKHVLQVSLRGSAFLWHQVRCMVAILILVGEGKESPDIVRKLLDVQNWGCKPQYNMADEEPLLLYGCGYNTLKFHASAKCAEANLHEIESMIGRHVARVALLSSIGDVLQTKLYNITGQRSEGNILPFRKHIAIEKREREPSLEVKFAKFGKTVTMPASAYTIRDAPQSL